MKKKKLKREKQKNYSIQMDFFYPAYIRHLRRLKRFLCSEDQK